MSNKSIGLDLSKFTHVSSDKDSHTLKHYEGHELKIATKALSKSHREALQTMADKAQAKAQAKGDNRLSTDPDKLAAGGKVGYEKENSGMTGGGGPTSGAMANVNTTTGKVGSINAPTASSGVNAANAVRSSGAASPYGQVIRVPSKDKGYADGGQIVPHGSEMGPQDEEHSKIMSEMGSRQQYAEGGIPYALDPDILTNPEKSLDFSGLPDASTQGINSTLQAIDQQPAQRLEHMKEAGYGDTYNQGQMLDKLDREKAATEQDAATRASQVGMQAQSQFDTLSKLAQQKQAHGIPLSPAEQQALSPQSTVGQQQGMQPEPGVQNAAAQAGPVQTPQANPNDPESMLQSGYNKQMAGIQQAGAAQGALGQEQAGLLEKQALAQTTAKAHYDETYNKLDQERQALIQDVQDGHIDPNKYWEGDSKTGEGGHSKIMAGIGMILAGFNPTNNPNAAIKFIQYQMDQNIAAQQKNLESKQSLLSHNLQQFHNLKDATEMTRIMQNDIVAHQLQAAAAKAQTPMAKAAALQAAGQLQTQSAPMFQQFAMRRAMVNLANSSGGQQSPEAVNQMISYMRMTNPEQAKEMESRFVPGVGLASVPIPQEARTEMIGKQNFDQMAQHYVQWAKQNAGSLNPAKINEGATMAAELQGAYRMAIKGGTFKEGEQEFIEKLIPSDPAQFAASIRTLPKLQALVSSNQAQLNQLKKGYGLPGQQTQQSNEPEIKTMGGVKYMKAPGGWKKVK